MNTPPTWNAEYLHGLDLDAVLSDTAAWAYDHDLKAHDAAFTAAVETAGDAKDRADSRRLADLNPTATKTRGNAKRAHIASCRVLRGAA